MIARPRQFVRFLLPWVVGLTALTLLPMMASLALSLSRNGGRLSATDFTWAGTQHYREALSIDTSHTLHPEDPWYWKLLGGKPNDPRLYTSLYNSLFYSLIAVPLGLAVSLAVALLIHRPIPGMGLARALLYLPTVLGGVATLAIWSWLLNPQFGWINRAIRLTFDLLDGIVRPLTGRGTTSWPAPDWLYSPISCKPALILMHLWTTGGAMLIFIAARRRVPPELYHAAQLDGAGAFPQFRCITWPQMTPAVFFNLLVSFIFSMQSFNESYLLQNRRQNDGILFLALYVYQTAFEPPYSLGYACALAWILFAVLLLFIVPVTWTSRRWVHYVDGH